ncbi:OmpA family protein [Robertkochia flava]|uniref:OmpA family protein n=1 Tax=Robertkochia flava TaxID=3447986 RepID=UPI001CCDC63D|nr:OmpA family protein [Robertkochia marina]
MRRHLHVMASALFIILFTVQAHAQYEKQGWLFGGGFNFIDDSGTNGSEPFNFTENWSSVVFPSRFSMGYALTNGMFFQGFASYNRYQKDVIVDGNPQSTEWNYYALDGMIGYGFKNMIDPRGWFDPFINTGMGVNRLAGNNSLTYNLGAGFNFWFNDRFAVNLSTLGKWQLGDGSGDNHIQHGIGVVFKPDLGKLFAGKQETEENNTLVVNDSINKQPEIDRSLVASTENTPLEKEEETVPPAAETQPVKSVSEEEKRVAIINRLKSDLASVERISFEVNSSFITLEDLEKIDQLAAFLNYYPTTVIEIRGNVDPRGSEEYNAWLSVRRANRIKAYLSTQGVAPERIKAVGSIQNEIEGPCREGQPCTEEQLRESRRVEYILLDF